MAWLTRILQILLLVASLLIVIIAGYTFEEFIRTVGAHFSIAIGGKHLPEIFEWLAGRRGLVRLLMLLPWFALVGLPLLTNAGVRQYWEPGSFALRYLAFLTAELFLVLMFFFCVSTTFSAIYPSLHLHRSGPPVPLGWIIATLTGFLIAGAALRIAKSRSSQGEDANLT